MTGPRFEPDPVVLLNPWIASVYTADAITGIFVWFLATMRRRAEVRRLEAVAVLPLGWDAGGRLTAGSEKSERPGGPRQRRRRR